MVEGPQRVVQDGYLTFAEREAEPGGEGVVEEVLKERG